MPTPRESSGRWGTMPNPVKPSPKYSFTGRVSELFNPNCTKVEIEAFCGPSLAGIAFLPSGAGVSVERPQNTLAAEQVESAGAVFRDAKWSMQHAGLIP